MQAYVYKLQQILDGKIQYVIPYFQRNYSWEQEEWEQLWQDIEESIEVQATHFFGPIVTRQIISGIGDVRRNQIIDGQQRITTLFIIFALIRNKAIENGDIDLAEDIHETYLVNKRQKEGYFKLMPSKIDRKIFKELIDIEKPFGENYLQYKSLLRSENKESKIIDAYNFFVKKMEKYDNDALKNIKTIIITRLEVTSQVLDDNDDPYKIYAGLNAKGRQLTKADLIRNYFFECIPDEAEQDKVYDELWMPMEVAIKEQLKEGDKEEGLKEYIKHYLIYCQGSRVKEDEIYSILRHNVDQKNVVQYLKDLFNYSCYYKILLTPELENDIDIRKRLNRLNDMDMTTVYPLLLNFYSYRAEKKIEIKDFIDILDTIINYLIRRYVCDIPSNSLNDIISSIISHLKEYENNLVPGLKILLQSKDYPKDDEFKAKFKELNYVAGVRGKKIKTILEAVEDYYGQRHGGKETVFCNNTQIEHVMPQTLTEQWKQDMGDEWKNTHEQYLHNIGNLTLTGYNTDLSNKDFLTKKRQLGSKSRFELNKYFSDIEKWNKDEIEERANILSAHAIEVWPYFGVIAEIKPPKIGIRPEQKTGTKPDPKTGIRSEQKTGTKPEIPIDDNDDDYAENHPCTSKPPKICVNGKHCITRFKKGECYNRECINKDLDNFSFNEQIYNKDRRGNRLDWIGMTITLSDIVSTECKDIFNKLNIRGTRGRNFASNSPDRMFKPKKIDGTDIYIETNMSADYHVGLCRAILEGCNYDYKKCFQVNTT